MELVGLFISQPRVVEAVLLFHVLAMVGPGWRRNLCRLETTKMVT